MIVQGKIPSIKIYEDDRVLSIMDINPINTGHCLVIPKQHHVTLLDVSPEDLQACALVSQRIAKAVMKAVGASGLNFLQNNFRSAGQLIDHIHFHLIPRYENDGFLTTWPGKPCPPGELEKTFAKIKAAL
jgi:histidine triad (HIT) family protein